MVNIKIIDNFLNKEDFNELTSLNIKKSERVNRFGESL